MTQKIITMTLDPDSYQVYLEHSRPKKGSLLSEAIDHFFTSECVLELSKIPSKATVFTDPERNISLGIDEETWMMIRAIANDNGLKISNLVRYMLNLYTTEKLNFEMPFETTRRIGQRSGWSATISKKPLVDDFFLDFSNDKKMQVTGVSQNEISIVLPPRDQPRLVTLKSCIRRFVTSFESEVVNKPVPDGYSSTMLAAIDSVYSANALYQSVLNIVNRLRGKMESSLQPGESLEKFDLEYLLRVHENIISKFIYEEPSDALADHLYGNRSVIGGQRKAIVVGNLARQVLTAHERVEGINEPLKSYQDFQVLWRSSDSRKTSERLLLDIQKVRGIGPATARYFLLLLGGPFVKPDIMCMRFVSRALGVGVTADETSSLLEVAISQLIVEEGWSYSVPVIDHWIWQYISGRISLSFDFNDDMEQFSEVEFKEND